MAEITSALIKDLREKTGAGMMDCKKALTESNGDIEGAIDWLRKKGLSQAAKKASRVAAQGLVSAITNGTSGVAVEVNSETDFVSRNDLFQNLVSGVAKIALELNGDVEKIKEAKLGEKTVSENLTDLIAKIGENMNLRRAQALSVKEGVVCSYIHGAINADSGKIGVLVALESKAEKAKLEELGKKLAMHIAAVSPLFHTIESVDKDALEREKAVHVEKAKASGKPANIIEKMVEGSIRKYYEEVVLEEQLFVIEPDLKLKVKDYVAKASKDLGAEVKLTGFVRFGLGEGIEKKETDFAAEVAAMQK
ncbi:MAG: Elongation factor Ts [Alphaproteobacteria bacterium ADurb.Bin438]|nr:MAG: Elongation factor Ts [Alphaproteobacteria bacterium ADurb.Bin438]